MTVGGAGVKVGGAAMSTIVPANAVAETGESTLIVETPMLDEGTKGMMEKLAVPPAPVTPTVEAVAVDPNGAPAGRGATSISGETDTVTGVPVPPAGSVIPMLKIGPAGTVKGLGLLVVPV